MRCFCLCLVVMVVFGLGTVAVANDDAHMLLSIPGAPGTFASAPYANWIEGVNLQHNVPGLAEPLALLSGASPGRNEGAFTYPEGGTISFTKEVDKCSPRLADLCRNGKLIPSMKLALCRVVNGDLKPVLSLNFEEIKICSYQVFAPGFGDRATLIPIEENVPVELLLLMPKSVRWKLALM